VARVPPRAARAAHTRFRALGIDPKKTEFGNHGQPLPIAHDDMAPIKEALA